MDIGKIQPVEITQELSRSYLDYAMSVIVARALPDVRDGLKPVHRRILFAMHQLGLGEGAFSKSAKVVGEVLGKYHPHGDVPVYDALVRLAQDFSMRYPLVKGQGNFGSVDGDPPAAMRYTEVKLAKIAEGLLSDLDKETVDFLDNFDATLKEPSFLPAKLPNLLLMGSEGIAVGMATKIPPHNLGEVISAIIATLKKGKLESVRRGNGQQKDFFIKKIELQATGQQKLDSEVGLPQIQFDSEISIEELLELVKGPDFPTGGAIYDARSIAETYATGRGKIVVRGIAKIEDDNRGRMRIVISEIPYQVNKAQLVTRIAELIRGKRITGIADLRDESDQRGLSVVLELKKDAKPQAILANLFKHTQLQISFPANFVALVEGTPRTLNLKQILIEYVRHRIQVIVRRAIFELREAKRRSHILEGLKIALDNLDAVIATIKKSADADEAKNNLVKKFALSEIQAQAILDMQLRRLARLEREKIEQEFAEIAKKIEFLTSLLTNPEKILEVIEKELAELLQTYSDERRTRVFKSPVAEFSEEDLVAKEEILITVTKTGYVKRVSKEAFRAQRRGGKGVLGMTTKEEDEIAHLVSASTHDRLLFFTNKGRVFRIGAWEVPEGTRMARGQAIINLLNIDQDEQIQAILPLTEGAESDYFLMATQGGTVKKTKVQDFAKIRSSGLIAIKLAKGDSLVWVKPTKGTDLVLLITHGGKAIKFSEEGVRPMGRTAQGVRGIRLISGDEVVGMEVFASQEQKPPDRRIRTFRDILVVMEKGLGKRTPVRLFPLQRRGGQGVKIANITDRTGKVVGALMVTESDEQVVLNSKSGQVIKLPLKNIPQLGRATQGVILMRFSKKDDTVAAVATLEKEKEVESVAKL